MRIRKTYQLFAMDAHFEVFSTGPPPPTLMVTFGLRAEPWEVVVVFSFLLGCWRIVGIPYDRRNTLRFRGWSSRSSTTHINLLTRWYIDIYNIL